MKAKLGPVWLLLGKERRDAWARTLTMILLKGISTYVLTGGGLSSAGGGLVAG